MKRFCRFCAIGALLMLAGVQSIEAAVADRVVAVVGDEMILQSQIDEQAMMARLQYPEKANDPSLKSGILKMLVDRKIVLTKARLDSIAVNEADIERKAEERMGFLRQKFRSLEEMEAAFSKSYMEIEKEIKDDIRENQLINDLRRKKMKGVTVSYEEVERFYRDNQNLLPMAPETVEISQIVLYPTVTAKARSEALRTIQEIQEKLKAGADFAETARQYSQDPGSARFGGDLGYSRRGEFVKSFEDVAFSLDEGEISGVVETRFGFHIIQLLKKEQDAVHTRHILVVFDRSALDARAAKAKLEEIRRNILNGTAEFAEMARKYSDDPLSSKNGGKISNAETGETRLAVSALRSPLKEAVESLKNVGDLSGAVQIKPESGEPFYALFLLNSRVPAHRLKISSDYGLLEKYALEEKQKRLFQEWIEGLQKEVYVRISDI